MTLTYFQVRSEDGYTYDLEFPANITSTMLSFSPLNDDYPMLVEFVTPIADKQQRMTVVDFEEFFYISYAGEYVAVPDSGIQITLESREGIIEALGSVTVTPLNAASVTVASQPSGTLFVVSHLFALRQ